MLLNTFRLKVFLQVAELRSFSRAAERLYLTQPAVSTHIKELESSLGVPLFERRVPLALTPGGEVLLEAAGRLIADVEEAEVAVKELAGAIAGKVGVGISLAWKKQLTPLALEFAQQYPKAFLSLRFGSFDEFAQLLLTDEIGVAFVARPAPDARLESQQLLVVETPLYAVVPARHPLAALPKVSKEQLQQYPFAYFSPRMAVPTLEQLGARPQYRIEIDDRDGVLAAVAAGLGVSVMGEGIVRELPRTLRAVPLSLPPWRQPLTMIRARHRRLSKAEECFLDYMLAAAPGSIGAAQPREARSVAISTQA